MMLRVVAAMVGFYFLLLLSPLAVNIFFGYQLTWWLGFEHVLWATVLLAGLLVGCTWATIREVRELKRALKETTEGDERKGD